MKEPILSISNLKVSFNQYTKGLRKKQLNVINGLDIELYKGEILAIVGSSGSGKSLLAHSILDILPENGEYSGDIVFHSKRLTKKDQRSLRGKSIVLIPQSVNYLDPLMKVSDQIKISIKEKNKDEKLKAIFSQYELPEEALNYYPHQLSGGMARKVLIATAITSDAQVIIADEPTPGLDEKSLNEVLKDLREFANNNSAVLMITHDIKAALKIADKIAIFYGGTTLEVANVSDFENNLRHPYTKSLFDALPSEDFIPISGTQPLCFNDRMGCIFVDRCVSPKEICRQSSPPMRNLRDGKVRCYHAT